MSELQFNDEISRIQEAISGTPAFVQQRAETLEALAPSPHEDLLDLGCGTGHMLLDAAKAVGPSGRVHGLDASEDMLSLAGQRCAGVVDVDLHQGDLYDLPFSAGSLDAVFSVQVFEYLSDVAAALGEIHRVLRPGGRVLIRDVDWSAQLWRSSDPIRMQEVMEVWDQHLVDPHLPQTLSPRLRDSGFQLDSVRGIATVETECSKTSMNYHLIKFIQPYVVGEGFDERRADAWASDLFELHERGDYFFSHVGYAFAARKP
jgi:SAM-dependent methyltransferase